MRYQRLRRGRVQHLQLLRLEDLELHELGLRDIRLSSGETHQRCELRELSDVRQRSTGRHVLFLHEHLCSSGRLGTV
jgi:hypothetical protein